MRHTIILLLIVCQSLIAYANDEFDSCQSFADIAPQRPELPPPEGDLIQIFADQAVVQEKQGSSIFSGNVLMQQADQILSTPIIEYNRNNEVIDAENKFTLWNNKFIMRGGKLQLRSDNQGEMSNAEYWLLQRRARGYARKIIKQSKNIVILKDSSYTTCASKKAFWRLNASTISLNEETSQGVANHVTLRLLDVPVLYFPYLSFPLGKNRQSGFLAPNFAISDETGTEFILPYYFNLAPHYDLLVTPRIMSRRGILFKNEFRYLTQTAEGNINAEYLPYDSSKGESRTLLGFQHQGMLTKRLSTDINVNYVSDNRYFEELGNNISTSSITHLERRGDISYAGNGWRGLGRVQMFQTIDPNSEARPYQRLPQIILETNLPEKNQQFNFSLGSEFVRFDRNIDAIEGPIGNRIHLTSSLSYPWRTSSSFIVPKLSLLYTHYDLENVDEENQEETAKYDRFLYRFSADSGLFFERDLNFFKRDLVQTLEPRLFYRNTSYDDQSMLPIFDTARHDLSFYQLFREDSFNGVDRVDDNHQLTVAVTSRLFGTKTGLEHLRASIGQIYYFEDQQVALPTENLEEQNQNYSSNIIMELATQLNQSLRITSSFRWDPHTDDTEQSVLQMRYQTDSKNIFNFSYRLREDSIEQTDMSFHWALNSRWNVLGRWNVSLPDKKTLEVFSGLEYSSCCWAVRGIVRRYLNSDDNGYLNAFFIQLHLKGLGGVGKKADTFLADSIPGFQDHF